MRNIQTVFQDDLKVWMQMMNVKPQFVQVCDVSEEQFESSERDGVCLQSQV